MNKTVFASMTNSIFLLAFVVLCILPLSLRAKEAELTIPPEEVVNYLNNLNESSREIKTSPDFNQHQGLSKKITRDLAWFGEYCNSAAEMNPGCVAKAAGILRNIHSYVNLSHDFVEEMITSLNIPADLRYSLIKSARIRVQDKKPVKDNTVPSIQKLFGAEGGSYTLTVLTGLQEVFAPLPDHGPKLEKALVERLVELEANYAFLKGAKRYLTNLAQLKYARLSAKTAESRLNTLLEPLVFLKGLFSQEVATAGDEKKPAAVLILDQLKKEQ